MNTDLAAQRSLDHLRRDGLLALTGIETTLATVWTFAAGVNNGGFAGYFASHRGDLAFQAPAALHAIGAPTLATLAAQANAVFGPNGPPPDRRLRRKRLRALPEAERIFAELDRRYFACDEDVDQLMENFLAERSGSH